MEELRDQSDPILIETCPAPKRTSKANSKSPESDNEEKQKPSKSFADVRTPITGETKAKALEYNMSDFMSQCVERYCELAKFERSKLKKAETPFLDEQKTYYRGNLLHRH